MLRGFPFQDGKGILKPGGGVWMLSMLVFWGHPAWAQLSHLEAERQKNFGVAYLEQEQPKEAASAFARVIASAPEEALGYANLGLAYLRMGQADSAAFWLERARQREAEHVGVLLLVAEVQQWEGDRTGAMATLGQALRVRPQDRVACYALYRAAVAQKGDAGALAVAAREMDRLFGLAPRNLAVAVKYARFQAEQGNPEGAARGLEALRPAVLDMAMPRRVLDGVEKALAAGDAQGIRRGLTVLENVLRPTPRYKQALGEVQQPVVGLPLVRFSRSFYEGLKRERPPEIPVRFVPLDRAALPAPGPVAVRRAAAVGSIDAADVDGDGHEDLLVGFSDGERGGLQLWRRAGRGWVPVLPDGVAGPAAETRFVDFDNDGVFDVVAVGRGGLRLLRGDSTGVWQDVTASAGLSPEPGGTVELVDADNEGDLDFCVGSKEGVRLWQNRLDGTFREVSGQAGLSGPGGGIVQVAAFDHDDDGDTDLLGVEDAGGLRLFDNLRQGRFAGVARGLDTTACRSVLAADLDNNGRLDLVLVGRAGSVWIQYNTGKGFAPGVKVAVGGTSVRALTAFDFDNDGWTDLSVAGTRNGGPALAVLRNRGDGGWEVRPLGRALRGCVALLGVELDGDGDLDLLALDGAGQLRGWRNEGGNAHHFLRVRLKGLRTGGTKNNLRGVGSKVEIKAGLHYQMRVVRAPVTHFGLGKQARADLMRVTWSNGVPQNVLRPSADQTITEVQILKGSCPFLYCWDGERFAFVTDLLGASPLGLQVAEGVVAPHNPRELMTVPGDRIAVRDGDYVFQFTEELWETVYLDEVGLWVVDHPPGVEVFTDQRFLPPPYAPPRPMLTRGRVRPVRAEDSRGREVTERLLAFDHRYPERLRPSRYQGIVAPHALTLYFGEVRGLDHPLLAIGCWIFWTDTSINVSMSQGRAVTPSLPVVEVWHPVSGWQTLDAPFGLPTGKDKWVMLDLGDALYAPDARVRIRTNYQIYWDQAFLTDAAPEAPHRITRLGPRSADLHYGGFSRMYRPSEDGPHLFDYTQRVSLPLWPDMEGMATRYGDVTELLTAADDRYVIMTAGDEVTVRFDAGALPRLRPGWERDFLFLSDGWDKDADKNTVTGDRVGPLPFHAMSAYPYPASETYPDGEAHRVYRARYNTRRIGPEGFRAFVKTYGGAPVPALPWEAR